ncbi:GMC family oxidoreductase [Nocardioides stalactiti]|uniref:GMC family oxidoreductase n=1 Tax=Nocardioides stalactiti TaxID=2755356 RepID=UPI0016049A01|nr:GMC family oxidoreductase [Nocardioides stalactiti]
MTFSAREREAMRLICDTFAPGDGAGVPAASQCGAVDLTLEVAAANPRAPELRQLKGLLRIWDTRGFALALTGRPQRFSQRGQAGRERFLLSLSDSNLAQKRALFAALKSAALLPYYLRGGGPLWEPMGYSGPLGVRADAPPRTLTTHRATGATTLDCDVVVVGSGAGGGTAAAVLAGAGLDVVVLEAGDHHDENDFDGSEESGFLNLYALAPQATAEGQINLLAGRGLGGGTVVNYTTSFRTPDHVRQEWADLGAKQFVTEEYDAALDAVCARLGVNTDHDRAAPRDAILERGALALGWESAAMPRNVIGCDQGIECGRCGMGCRLGAKQSVTKTWLEDAAAAGARLYTGVTARTVTQANGRATGVEGVTAEGHPVTVRARAVVAAAGAIQTPALLHRSGLTNPNVGAHLRLHPATAVWGLMSERVDPWVGAMQSRYVNKLTNLDGKGYGVLYETAPITPGLGTGFIGWRGSTAFRRRMIELRDSLGIAVILRDRDSVGTVRTKRDGEPVVRYKLSDGDSEHLVQGLVGAARIAEAAGASRITTTHHQTVSYEPGARGDLTSFEADVRAAGTAPGRMTLAALHIMGSARMGDSSATSAIDPDGQTWDLRDLYVADGSCFPTASGVNPMISIESIAYMTATRLATRLA